MRRRLMLLLVLALLFCCAACGQSGMEEGSFPHQETTALEQAEERVEILPIGISGEVSIAMPFRGGYLAQSYDRQDEAGAISLLDSEGQALWTYKVEGCSEGMIPVGDGLILLKGIKRAYTALDGEGHELWRRQVGDDYYKPEVFLPDHAGGAYAFGPEFLTGMQQCQRWHITANGEVRGPEPYTEIPNCSVLSGWAGEDGEYWLEVISGGAGEPRWMARLDENLRPLARFELKKNQYPHPAFFPEANRILLFGQAYRGSGHDGDLQEYGCLYEIDYDCNLIHSETFEGMVPNGVARLKDGRWVVSFYTRDNAVLDPVYLYSPDWKQKMEIKIDYAFTSIIALEDGGFVILGLRLAEGQHESALYINSRRPKMDTIYSRYNAAGELLSEKTFYAKDSESGYGFYVLVDTQGRVLTE